MPPAKTKAFTASPELLARCELFTALKRPDLERLLEITRSFEAAVGREVFREGEPCHALHFVLEGRVKLCKVSLEGREQILREVHPGQAFGGAPLFVPEGRYPVTAVASERSRILSLPKAELLGMVAQRPELALGLLASLASHQLEMMRLVQGLSLERVQVRVARHILERARAEGGPKSGQQLTLGCTQAELAAKLGSVREVVWRSLRDLKRLGALDYRGSRITLRDLEALKEGV